MYLWRISITADIFNGAQEFRKESRTSHIAPRTSRDQEAQPLLDVVNCTKLSDTRETTTCPTQLTRDSMPLVCRLSTLD